MIQLWNAIFLLSVILIPSYQASTLLIFNSVTTKSYPLMLLKYISCQLQIHCILSCILVTFPRFLGFSCSCDLCVCVCVWEPIPVPDLLHYKLIWKGNWYVLVGRMDGWMDGCTDTDSHVLYPHPEYTRGEVTHRRVVDVAQKASLLEPWVVIPPSS